MRTPRQPFGEQSISSIAKAVRKRMRWIRVAQALRGPARYKTGRRPADPWRSVDDRSGVGSADLLHEGLQLAAHL